MFSKKKYMNPYYWTCPYCQANLDLNEKCDCPESQGVDVNYSDVKPINSNKERECNHGSSDTSITVEQ